MSNAVKDGGPAFPGVDPPEWQAISDGMSLRDWFAGQALAALISKAPFFECEGEYGKAIDIAQFKVDIAESSYGYADAMIAAREVTP